MILWCQADPSCELPAGLEHFGCRGLHQKQCRPDGADARDLGQSAAALIGIVPSFKFDVDLLDLDLQFRIFLALNHKQLTRRSWPGCAGLQSPDHRTDMRLQTDESVPTLAREVFAVQ